MSHSPLLAVVRAQKRGEAQGITSICSAHPQVIEAAFAQALERDAPLLIESTCNQVNQDGGYTGYTPAAFMDYLQRVADQFKFPQERLVLGGDHLGPNPWRHEPARQAMDKARRLVEDYVAAGYVKIHLDASMRCADDDPARPLPPEVAADRSAELALVAEESARQRGGGRPPLYVVGTEVPVPGGAEGRKEQLAVTRPDDMLQTLALTQHAFNRRGLEAAWERVIAVVVQPGVEFGSDSLETYDPEKGRELAQAIEGVKGMVYEAHSTDYQTPQALRHLVKDHFAILKVGPALTFALREAIFALALIEGEWLSGRPGLRLSHLRQVIEETMLADPGHWRSHYHGDPEQQRLARAFSFSDRLRYYWPAPPIQAALEQLWRNLSAAPIPLTLLSQYLPRQYQRVRRGKLADEPSALVRDGVTAVLDEYSTACGT